LKKSTTQFLTTEQVDKNVAFSVREMIKKISGGQGILSCSCKAKNPCQSDVLVLKIICNVTVDVIINLHVKINNKEKNVE